MARIWLPAKTTLARALRGELLAPFETPKTKRMPSSLFGRKHYLIDFHDNKILGNMAWTSVPLSDDTDWQGVTVDSGKNAYVYSSDGAVSIGNNDTVGDITTSENISVVCYFKELSTSGAEFFFTLGGGANGAITIQRRSAAKTLNIDLLTSGADYLSQYALDGVIEDGDEVIVGVAWNTSAGTATLLYHDITKGVREEYTTSGLGAPISTANPSTFANVDHSRALYLLAGDYRLWSTAQLKEIVFEGNFNLLYAANQSPILIGTAAAGGGVAVTVPQADLTLSTTAPTVLATANISIEIPQGNLVLDSAAPTISTSDALEITVPQADLVLSATAPTVAVTANIDIQVPAADLVLSTTAPTAVTTEAGTIIIPQADLTLSSTAPTVSLSENVAIEVPAGDLTLSSTAPQVGISWSIVVPQADLTLSVTAPSVLTGFNIFVPSADLALSSTAPAVSVTSAANITIPQANLTLSTTAPTVDQTGIEIWTEIPAVSTVWTEI